MGGGHWAVVRDIFIGWVDEGESNGEGKVDEYVDDEHSDNVDDHAAHVDGSGPNLVMELHPVQDAGHSHDGGQGVKVTGPEQDILNVIYRFTALKTQIYIFIKTQ